MISKAMWDVSMLAVFIWIVRFEWWRYFKQMSHQYKIKFTISCLGVLLAHLSIWNLVHSINYDFIVSMKSVWSVAFSLTILIPIAGYCMTKIKILNAEFKFHNDGCPKPKEYADWREALKIAKFLMILDILVVLYVLYGICAYGNELGSWIDWDGYMINKNN